MRVRKEWFRKTAFLVTIHLILSLSACSKGLIEIENSLPPVPDGYVRTTLDLSVEANQQVSTRASSNEESAYDKNNVWVLVFDQTAPALTAKLMQKPVKATLSGTAPDQKLHALLRATGESRKIYVMAGLSSTMNNNLANIMASQVESGNVTWDDLNALLETEDAPQSGIPIGGGTYIPMCSNEIDRTSAPNQGTATLSEIKATYKRIVAKIDIKCVKEEGSTETMMPLSDFQLTGAKLMNGSKRGLVLPQATLPFEFGGTQSYATVSSVTNNAITSQIYLYENYNQYPDGKEYNTTLIIQGKYKNSTTETFYRLDLLNTNMDGHRLSLSIERNTQYIVKISKVETAGYASLEEAYRNVASNNIKFNIIVTDPSAHDIVSNGIHYMGLSNSNFLLFSTETKSSVAIAQITHNAPPSFNEGTITLSNVVGTAPSILNNPFLVRNGTEQKSDLMMNIPSGLISCRVNLKLGNLSQSIYIERRTDMLSFGGYIAFGSGYSHGTFPNPIVWAKLSNSASDEVADGSSELNCSPSQAVYMILGDNLALEPGAANRSCELFLSGGKVPGRTKVWVDQPKFDIISQGAVGVIKDTYVGTFHRHDQRGERLIRISSTNKQYWVAQVVAGKDFIRLDESISDTPPGVSDAENFPVLGNKTRISGTDAIKFRVGLTGTIPSDQVRYGVITITHSGGINRIFVRQGEKADYVMRPNDPIYDNDNNLVSATRPYAKQISPYNLTDSAGRTGDRINLSNHAGRWVKYPSQAGYLFQANTPYAWAPHTNAVNFNSSPAVVSGFDNICPAGYRRIKDGTSPNPGIIVGSEIRQSIWYYPKSGQGRSDFENTIRGLLADGFFDRQASTEATTGYDRKTSTVGSGVEKAYIGALIFNPNNFASIFIPASGTLFEWGGGQLSNPGLDAIWWTSSYKDGATGNYWYGAMAYFNSSITFDNYPGYATMGATVRCVVGP